MDRSLVPYREDWGMQAANDGLTYQPRSNLGELAGRLNIYRCLGASLTAHIAGPTSQSSCYHPTIHHSHRSRLARMGDRFAGHQPDEFREADLDRQRVQKLGFAFTSVPMSAEHESYLRMSAEQKEALAATAASAQTGTFVQVSEA